MKFMYLHNQIKTLYFDFPVALDLSLSCCTTQNLVNFKTARGLCEDLVQQNELRVQHVFRRNIFRRQISEPSKKRPQRLCNHHTTKQEQKREKNV